MSRLNLFAPLSYVHFLQRPDLEQPYRDETIHKHCTVGTAECLPKALRRMIPKPTVEMEKVLIREEKVCEVEDLEVIVKFKKMMSQWRDCRRLREVGMFDRLAESDCEKQQPLISGQFTSFT